MYKIIGADGKEYGPITIDQLKQWITESRINAQTKVLPEGATEWKTLAEIPELAAALPITPPSAPAFATADEPAGDQAKGPGIGMIVAGILNVLASLARLALLLAGVGMGALNGAGHNPEVDKLVFAIAGTTGIVFGVIGLIVGLFVIYSGIKMQKLENHGLCLLAAILLIIPCTSPCCPVGIPIGIWALVVLSKSEVKNAFH